MNSCKYCELDFGSARDDGPIVVRSSDRYYPEYCHECAVAKDNHDEAAWIQHETDRFFGG